ncbi:MAG: prenyltransferase/squalene oxidase repeat-containing protein, partial [Myxococcota bacterium]|nr:prenyltransferase/squalene oxidase repeat-containing protein [Myxococcota bacterium]
TLRQELYPRGYAREDFPTLRGALRSGDIYTPPSRALRVLYAGARMVDRHHSPAHRSQLLASLRKLIRWELETTAHTSISPVSGLLNIIALWLEEPAAPTVTRALAAFEGWIWEDDTDGLRVAGARSASWDTAFALQALAQAAPHVEVTEATERGVRFLQSQQILESFPGYERAHRNDPHGGWCFAGVWHGWPVSDCTAEAMIALVECPSAGPEDGERLAAAARFILRAQNPDGGFGSYEHQKSRVPLEWLNPAEMFGDSMTEHSYVECTASCIGALAAFTKRFPERETDAIRRAVDRAVRVLRDAQNADGSWSAVWGVHFTYGTLFGIRGLIAGGAKVTDSAIRKACAWLLAHQRPDGGWGEHHQSALGDTIVEAHHSQVIQTSWALAALLEAQEPNWDAIERAADFLALAQGPDGEWPEQEMAGVFFHTALLHYKLYRRYFPVWALGLFETRR